jgi:hypothetical protein
MSDKAVLVVCAYLLVSFGLGVFVGKAIKWANPSPCQHVWEEKGYGGAGWTLVRCSRCGASEIQ